MLWEFAKEACTTGQEHEIQGENFPAQDVPIDDDYQ